MTHTRRIRILIIDGDQNFLRSLTHLLEKNDFNVRGEESGKAGLRAVREETFDVILASQVASGGDGTALLDELRAESAQTPVIMLAAQGTIAAAVDAIQRGASDFLAKPIRPEDLLRNIQHHADLVRLRRMSPERPATGVDNSLLGVSRAVQDLLHQIAIVSGTHAPVLVTGESGAGKELVARAIHAQSRRADGPLVKVSCPLLSEAMLENDLFGSNQLHTTPDARHLDHHQPTVGGTIFLDEVGDTPLGVQVKLLKVLQETAFDPDIETVCAAAGDSPSPSIRPKARVLASTRSDIPAKVRAGSFREDLFYRLNVVTIPVPALRNRREDIPLLVNHFMQRAAAGMQRTVSRVAPSCLKLLQAYPWPGNVRQLENAIERAVMFCERSTITIADLGPDFRHDPQFTGPTCPDDFDIHCHVRETERACIRRALEATGGNRTKAAQLLGISRKTLWEKCRDLGLHSA